MLRREEVEQLVAALEGGEEVEPLRLVRVLLRPECPRRLVEALCANPAAFRDRRVLALLVRHPACSQRVAWDGLPRLLWRELHEVCRDPRTPPAVRAQAERRLVDRLPGLALGERIALAKVATRGVIAALLSDPERRCVAALLDNPRFTESDALRLLGCNPDTGCLLAVLRHPRWGRSVAVTRVAVRLPRLPLGVVLGLVAGLSDHEIAKLVASPETTASLRDALVGLQGHRQSRRRPPPS